jgi:hypothetical protein
MSSRVSNAPLAVPKEYPLFDQSIFFGAALRETLEVMKIKALSEVPRAAEAWKSLDSTRRIARKLIDQIYEEFTQTLRKDY